MELYKELRPKSFDEMVGQQAAVEMLSTMLDRGNLPQSILFSGPSGCGKTTLARILAHDQRIGCSEMDMAEINSSSYRGVDGVRELSRLSELCPMGKSRVWILDEVHKLTSDAQHASLKMLEDTPRSTYFFLCTTNPEKLIKPIRTRCTDVVLPALKDDDLEELLTRTAKKIKVDVSSVSDELITAAQGSARVLLVLLDRIRHVGQDRWPALIASGESTQPEVIELCRALFKKVAWKKVAEILRGLDEDPESVRWAVLGYAQSVLVKQESAHAYEMIKCFAEPFYETKKAGLVASCYEVICGSKEI
jgi:DNA polymerase III gamma/tau subunit